MSKKMQEYINGLSNEELLEHADNILSILDGNKEDCLALFKLYLDIDDNVDFGVYLEDEDLEQVKNLVRKRLSEIDRNLVFKEYFSNSDIEEMFRRGVEKLKQQYTENEIDMLLNAPVDPDRMWDSELDIEQQRKEELLSRIEAELKWLRETTTDEILENKISALEDLQKLIKNPPKECSNVKEIIDFWRNDTTHFRNQATKIHVSTAVIIKQEGTFIDHILDFINGLIKDFGTLNVHVSISSNTLSPSSVGESLTESQEFNTDLTQLSPEKKHSEVIMDNKEKILLRIKNELDRLHHSSSILNSCDVTENKIDALLELYRLIHSPRGNCNTFGEIIDLWLKDNTKYRIKDSKNEYVPIRTIIEQRSGRFGFFTPKNDTLDFIDELKGDFGKLPVHASNEKNNISFRSCS